MKRKSRNKVVKDKSINMMEPIQFDKLGTVDDPCFGKHHDPTANECSVCGDAEICSVICSQKLHAKRLLIEEKKDFKDLQNLTCTWKEVSKAIKRALKKYPNGLPLPTVKTKVVKKLKIHESEFDKFMAVVLTKAKTLKFNAKENHIKYVK